MHQTHHFQIKIKKNSGEGAQPPPQTSPRLPSGEGTPTPHLTPFSFWGTLSPRPPPELCPWTTLGDFRSTSSPIAAFSGNESLC